MPKFKDLTGQRFGRLVVERYAGSSKHGIAQWHCKCDCGAEKIILAQSLKRGLTRSCGCIKREESESVQGKRFGRLLVVKRSTTRNTKNHNTKWECVCDCGTVLTVDRCSLIQGNTKSCGCLHKDTTRIDITGRRFGRLTAVKRVGINASRSSLWLCKCVCGVEVVVGISSLNYGATQSCGCLRLERSKSAVLTHGMSLTKLYRLWINIKSRCFNPNTPKFKNHGGRGITVCKKWMSFENFSQWAITHGYSPGLTIERRNNDGGYSADNCYFATHAEQNINKRDNYLINFDGTTMPLCEWSKKTGLRYGTLRARIVDYRWPIDLALTTPSSRKNILKNLSAKQEGGL